MKKTESLMFRLEKLKNSLCLNVKVSDRGGFYQAFDTDVYSFAGWEEAQVEVKPIFGKKRIETHIIKLFTKNVNNIYTSYVSVWDKNLDFYLDYFERDRKLFVKMREDLEKFHWNIKRIEDDK